MKKFCLLAIASCFATLGFSQTAKGVRPATKNANTNTTAVASSTAPSQFTNAANQAKPAVTPAPKANMRFKKVHAKS